MDPVHFHNGKWWFWDEVWAHCLGPYETREAAEEACRQYAKEL